MENVFRKRNRKPDSLSKKIVFGIAFVILFAYCIMVLYFFLFGFLISIKHNDASFTADMLQLKVFRIPKDFTLVHYLECFNSWEKYTKYSYWIMLWNSVWRTVLSAFLTWFTTALVCYVIVHYKNKFTEVLYIVGLLISMIPLYGGQGAQYKLFTELNLKNNPLINITSITLYGSYFFYMVAFWQGISHSYAEAASLDGANDYQILFKVMLPQVLPSIVALFVMQFITAWNDYESTAVYMTHYPNLSYGIYDLMEKSRYMGNAPMYFSGVILALIPVIILFIAFQNTIMEKVYLGGLKG